MNRTLFFIFNIILLASFYSCSKSDKKDTRGPEVASTHADETSVSVNAAQSKIAGIKLGKVEQKQITGTVKVNGVLDVPPQQLISISVPLGGFLKNTELLQGSRVKKGQLIATIENMDFIEIQQDYLEARGQLELASADYARQQELAKENVNSQKTLQQAKTNYSTWNAKYNALREKLKVIHADIAAVEAGNVRSTMNVYSPIDGYVTQVNVNIGKFVSPTDVLFEIVDTSHLHAELIVFERDVPKIKIGQKVRFTLANESTERIATVYLIGRAIGQDRTVQIHCHLDTEDDELLPGMYLSGVVETGGTTVPALPDEAIVDFQGKQYIFVSSENAGSKMINAKEQTQHFEMVEVDAQRSGSGFTEISLPDSLQQADFVVKGAYELLSKIKNSEEEEGAH
jgi:membrane fusion protein, heavy metal efflux system